MYFVTFFQIYVCAHFPFDFEGGMWGEIILIFDQCLSIYFAYHMVVVQIYQSHIMR